MKGISVSIVRLVWITCFLGLVTGHKRNKDRKSDYLEDHCNKKLKVPLYQRMKLTRDLFYKHGWHCDVTLEAPTHHAVSISFQKFDVGRGSSKVMICQDVLRIYDGASIKSSELTPPRGLCGKILPKQFVSSSETLTLKFKSHQVSTNEGFVIDVTSLGVMVNNSESSCPNNDFRCMGRFCLDRSLVCDGVPNCRDKTDESAKLAGCTGLEADLVDLSVGAKVAIFVAAVLLFLGIVCAFIYCCCCPSSSKNVYVPYKKI
ncbi:membrane frizzled-related protein-like [Argopecten irradians]|uniref:membrane frizzled-related protein-like n=1 Tax=Argopecten irradians TaxID=31199 RepID=UPI00371AAC01